MNLIKFIKALFMITLVGSSFMFSSPVVQKAVDTMETNPNKELGITDSINTQEILFWTFILAALGASIYILVRTLASFSSLRWDKFRDRLFSNIHLWHLG